MPTVYFVQVPTAIRKQLSLSSSHLFDREYEVALPLVSEFPKISQEDLVVFPSVFKVGKNYCNGVPLWLKLLQKKQQQAKALVVGWTKNTTNDANYIDAISIPPKLDKVVDNLESVNTMADFTANQGGIDLKSKIFRFFEGHGDESVLDELDKMIRMLKIASDEITIHKTQFDELWEGFLKPGQLEQKWENFYSRWLHYKQLFVCAPFYPELDQLTKEVDLIRPFFEQPSQQNLVKLDCLSRLETIKNKLLYIETIYV